MNNTINYPFSSKAGLLHPDNYFTHRTFSTTEPYLIREQKLLVNDYFLIHFLLTIIIVYFGYMVTSLLALFLFNDGVRYPRVREYVNSPITFFVNRIRTIMTLISKTCLICFSIFNIIDSSYYAPERANMDPDHPGYYSSDSDKQREEDESEESEKEDSEDSDSEDSEASEESEKEDSESEDDIEISISDGSISDNMSETEAGNENSLDHKIIHKRVDEIIKEFKSENLKVLESEAKTLVTDTTVPEEPAEDVLNSGIGWQEIEIDSNSESKDTDKNTDKTDKTDKSDKSDDGFAKKTFRLW